MLHGKGTSREVRLSHLFDFVFQKQVDFACWERRRGNNGDMGGRCSCSTEEGRANLALPTLPVPPATATLWALRRGRKGAQSSQHSARSSCMPQRLPTKGKG